MGLAEVAREDTRFNLVVTNLAPLNISPAIVLAKLTTLFPSVPIMHLHEVIPFSFEHFGDMVRQRMRTTPRA